MSAQQFGYLVEDDYHANPSFKANQDGLGDENGDKTKPQKAGQYERCSNQQGQGDCSPEHGVGISVRDDFTQFGPGQYRNRGRRADTQDP